MRDYRQEVGCGNAVEDGRGIEWVERFSRIGWYTWLAATGATEYGSRNTTVGSRPTGAPDSEMLTLFLLPDNPRTSHNIPYISGSSGTVVDGGYSHSTGSMDSGVQGVCNHVCGPCVSLASGTPVQSDNPPTRKSWVISTQRTLRSTPPLLSKAFSEA